MVHLGQRGIQSILLEGGSGLAGAALRLGLIDKFILFYAPKFLGGADGLGLFGGTSAARMEQAFCLETARVRRFGGDVMIEAYPEGTCSQG
jgi:diaminohydroxyphosphoribosylaminopyrimidine deaminase/5-amino-6-(5-phosphoribosylamino)uracil reductase